MGRTGRHPWEKRGSSAGAQLPCGLATFWNYPLLAVVLFYQQIENSVLTPTIQRKAVKLSAFFIIVAVALFGALLGVVGALIAVPVAATIQIVLGEVT